MPKSERGFRYQQRSKDDVKERANMRGGNFDSIIKPQYKLYKVKDGKNIVRILPPTWEKPKHYGYDIFVNYNIGADNQSYLSLSKMKSSKDPLAEARLAAQRDGDDEISKDLAPTQRIAVWVIDRQAEDEGPLLWAAPFTVDKAFANLAFDEDTKEVLFVDDPEKGYDIRFYKEGSQLTTKYDASKMKLLGPSPLNEDEGIQNDWLDYVNENPIPECLQYYSYEHIAGVYDGKATPTAEDEKPALRPSRRPTVKDEDEEPPFEVDPKPARVRPRAVVEDAEPDEAPARRRAETADEGPKEGGIRDRIRRRRAEVTEED